MDRQTDGSFFLKHEDGVKNLLIQENGFESKFGDRPFVTAVDVVQLENQPGDDD